MRNIHFLNTAVAVLAILAVEGWEGLAYANWPLAEMNAEIDDTNFVVNDGCSGTLISIPEKIILTNDHCLEGLVSMVGGKEKLSLVEVSQTHYKHYQEVGASSYAAEIIVHDPKVDLAILRIVQDNLNFKHAARFAPEGVDLIRGEDVIAVGNPALQEATIAHGYVSASALRTVASTPEGQVDGNQELNYIQFSGGIWPGSSGGSLYNGDGFLIGVPSSIKTERLMEKIPLRGPVSFIGFAIPVSSVRDFLKAHCFASIFDPKANDAKCRGTSPRVPQ